LAIIDPEGLFHGERLSACSDIAQLYWPRFFVASNGYARLELSYVSIISKIFGSFQKAPEASIVWEVFEEYSKNCLAVLYEYEGVWWAQFDTSAKYLPRFKTVRDEKSPSPPREVMEKHRLAYLEWKSSNSIANESFRKSPEDFGTFLMERRGVGVGVGVGIGEVKEKKLTAASAFELPLWVDPDLWDAYLDVRKKKRAVMTKRALEGIVKRLAEFGDKGWEPMEILGNSVRSNWIDVFEPKTGGTNGTGKRNKTDGNNAAFQRFMESQRDPRTIDSSSLDNPFRDAGEGSQQAINHPGLRGGADAGEPSAVHPGVQPRARNLQVLPQPGRTAKFLFPA